MNPLEEQQPGIATLPVEPGLILVVSDLHLAAGRDAVTQRYHRGENFFAGAAFRDFLLHHASGQAPNPLLVLAGDTFDFLRITDIPETDADLEGWSWTLAELGVPRDPADLRGLDPKEARYGFRTNDYKCVWKLLHVARGHPDFFAALGDWLKAGGWIVMLKGNHDVELFWPLMKQAIRREVALASKDAPVERLLFAEAGLQIGNVYIEHGHQYESVTRVPGDPVLPGGTELSLPLGSFVNRYIINSLERIDPFLDNQKPIQRSLWSIARQHPLQIFAILWHGVPFLRRAMRPYWFRDTLGFLVFFLTVALPVVTIALILAALVWSPIRGMLGQLGVLQAPLAVLGVFAPYVAGAIRDAWPRPRPRVGEDRLAEQLHQTLARVAFEWRHRVVYGVLGHTHHPDVQRLPRLSGAETIYLNCGTWIPCWDEQRPDLAGRTTYSFLRFRPDSSGSYQYESLEWLADVATSRPTRILSPHGYGRSGGFLNPREYRTVRSFGEVFIEGNEEVLSPDQVADNVDTHLARLRTKRTGSLRLALFVVEYLVPLLAGRGPFSRLNAKTRRRLLERYLAGPRTGRLLRNISKIRTLFVAGYYGDPTTHRSVGFVPVSERPRNLPPNDPLVPLGRPRLHLRPPAHGESVLEADLCVVGSGAGGAVVAALASEAKREVILLEEGRYVRSSEIGHDESAMSAALYKESGLQTTVDLGMTILQGRVLGGTTVINNHICFGLLGDEDLYPGAAERVLDGWERLGAGLDRGRLADSFNRVSGRIGVARIPDDIVGSNGCVLLDGWRALVNQGSGSHDFRSGKFKKNFDRCGACGYCNFGCPYERKLSMLETYVTAAERAGARLVTECHVDAILTDRHHSTGVRARLADGREIRVKAKQVVVAGGAIGSSVLLLRSGVRRNVGTRFSFNAATPVFAQFPAPLDAFNGDQMTTYVDSGEYILESSFNPPMAFAVALPGWFQTHFDRMRGFDRFASAGVVVGTVADGRVKRSALLRNLLGPVDWSMGREDFATLRRGMTMLTGAYFAAGADLVIPASFVDTPLRREDFTSAGRVDIDRIGGALDRAFRRPSDLTLNSSHPQGGNPMSDNPKMGAVTSECRVHGFDNLFVCDASVFPTTVRMNPQLSVMALADYAWHRAIGN
jgi:choline dehydrogenase-like flavoprotein/UDP-2,3-diacylglucosamine pyrophosphatase LpxH